MANGTQGWIEKMNQGVRGLVTLALCSVFCALAISGKISGEVFTAVFSGIVGFWFGNRGAAGSASPPQPQPDVAPTTRP
jgi:hypothetical protein